MFTQVAQMVPVPCTAAGVNSLTLTPIGSAPAFTSYQNFTAARFVATANSTAAVSAQFGSLANLPVYLADGVTQVTTQITLNQEYVLVFAQALNSGGGGFYLESAAVSAGLAVGGGLFSNLLLSNNASFPNTQISVSYDECVMNSPAGAAFRSVNQSFNINVANVGVVNGLDTGTIAANTWYYVFSISNGTTVGGLLSTSIAAPVMPTGYSYRKRLGAFRTDGSGNLFPFRQRQHRAQWATQTGQPYPVIASGIAAGSNIGLAAIVPATAISIIMKMTAINGQTNIGPDSNANAQNYAVINTTLNESMIVDMLFDTVSPPTVFYAATAAGCSLLLIGWVDSN